jgi:hypothetical protein
VTQPDVGQATEHPMDPNLTCTGAPGRDTLWFRFIPVTDCLLQIDTCETSYVPDVAVWTGACSGLSSVACARNPCAQPMLVPVTAGTHYLIEVARDTFSTLGSLRMTLQGCDGCGATYQVYLDTINPPAALACANATLPMCEPGPLIANTTYYWQVVTDNCCRSEAGPVRSFVTWQPGDTDLDGDVDMEDFGRFQTCLRGPGVEQPDADCTRARLDNDPDVDLDDLAIFKACLSGANVTPAPDCAGQ